MRRTHYLRQICQFENVCHDNRALQGSQDIWNPASGCLDLSRKDWYDCYCCCLKWTLIQSHSPRHQHCQWVPESMNVHLWPAENWCYNVEELNTETVVNVNWLNAIHCMQVTFTNAGLCETKVDPWCCVEKRAREGMAQLQTQVQYFWEKKFNGVDRSVRYLFPNLLAHDCIYISREWHILAALYHEDFLLGFCKVVYKIMISHLFTLTTFWVVLQNQEWYWGKLAILVRAACPLKRSRVLLRDQCESHVIPQLLLWW